MAPGTHAVAATKRSKPSATSAAVGHQRGANASVNQHVGLILELQRDYGNAHVARVIAQLQRAPAAAPPKAQLAQSQTAPQAQAQTGAPAQAAAQSQAAPPAQIAAPAQTAAPVEPEPSPQAQIAFNKLAFIFSVYQSVDSVTPKTLPADSGFTKSGAAEQVKATGAGAVAQSAQTAQQSIQAVTTTTPDPNKAVPKAPAPRVPPKPGPVKAGVDPGRAVPPAKPAVAESLAKGPAELNAIMAAGKVTDEQLADSNEPKLLAALAAKRKVEQAAGEAPGAYRAAERKERASSRTDAYTSIKQFVSGMRGRVSGALGRVDTKKLLARATQQFKRAEVAGKVEGIYTATRSEVKAILEGLDQKVEEKFTNEVANHNRNFDVFVDYHKERLLDSRYTGIGDTLDWWGDRATGLPKAAFNRIVAEAREVYLRKMFTLISAVAELVATELSRAKARIAQGRQEIKTFVGAQQGDLLRVAQTAEAEFADQFDQLDQDVSDERGNLVADLARKYTKARDAIDEHGQVLIDHNRGFIGDAKALVKDAVHTVEQLVDWLRDTVKRTEGVISRIIRHPIQFAENLIAAVRAGFTQFVGGIDTHLKDVLLGMVAGTLDGGGISLPETFDAGGILSLVLQVLGLSPASLRQRAVNFLGADVVDALEGMPGVISTLMKDGLGGLWTFVQTKFGELEDGLISQVKHWLMVTVVEKGVAWLVKMFVPGSGFFKACEAIYDTIRFFIKHGDIIKHVFDAILDSLESIADGSSGAAAKIESALTTFLKSAIMFLASLLDLDEIGERIKQIINQSFRDPINQLINAVLRGAAVAAGPLLNKVKGGVDWAKKKGRQVKDWALSKLQVKFKVGTEKHRLFYEQRGGQPQLMVASDPETVLAYLANLRPRIEQARALHGAADPKKFQKIDSLFSLVSAKATAAQAADLATNAARAEKLMAEVAWPQSELMAWTAAFKEKPAEAAATPNAAGLAPGHWLGLNMDIIRPNRHRVAGDQWKAFQVKSITGHEVKLDEFKTTFELTESLDRIVQDLVAGNETRFKRISGPDELIDHGLYVLGGMLKPEYRGGDLIRALFYEGDYAAYSTPLLGPAQHAAQAHGAFAAGRPGGGGAWGPGAWLCPGFMRSAHIIEDVGHVDHRIPVAHHWSTLGNKTNQGVRRKWNLDASNLQLLCGTCNQSKGSKMPDGTQAYYLDSVGSQFSGPNGKR